MEQNVLGEVYEQTRGAQVYQRHRQFDPYWVMDQAMAEEVELNWKGSYEELQEDDVHHGSNVIGYEIL